MILLQRQPKKTEIKISEFLKRHFYISLILDALLTLWYSLILPIWAKSIFFDENDRITGFGLFISITLTLLTLGFAIFRGIVDAKVRNSDSYQKVFNENGFLRKLLSGLYSVCEKKVSFLTSNIDNSSIKTNALNQLSEIFTQISNCLSFLLSSDNNRIDNEDLFINMLYKFDTEDEWNHFPINEIGISDEKLFSDGSFLSSLKRGNANYLFNNSKEELRADGKYIKDNRDSEEGGELQGSILGLRITVRINRKDRITALLFISTFDKKFTLNDKVENVKNNIKTILMQYESRIKVELLNLYKDQ